jgi:hypothetical protein
MTVEHKDIIDAERHEPKGISTATLDHVYHADGIGGGTWKETIDDINEVGIERLLDGLSTAGTQEPTGLDLPLQIEFGGAQFTGSDPVMISTDGTVTINETGLYRFKVSLAVGRSGGSGTSQLFVRVLVGGVQAGQSIHFQLGNSDVYTPYSDEAWVTIPAGAELKYEIVRDSAGVDAGGLFSGDPTLPDWNSNPCAAIRIERLVNV